ncbi:hypothetical protein NQ318_009666 [Aromia moschata]|uniref:Helix-turn-helix domain-containing protein n=1 Tax=Aromia moschata TaxID=1265417 RepID=A0AAV8Y058_9CUCU|nr:hypothetical protein NQ318_009666 [Aromia moschata]
MFKRVKKERPMGHKKRICRRRTIRCGPERRPSSRTLFQLKSMCKDLLTSHQRDKFSGVGLINFESLQVIPGHEFETKQYLSQSPTGAKLGRMTVGLVWRWPRGALMLSKGEILGSIAQQSEQRSEHTKPSITPWRGAGKGLKACDSDETTCWEGLSASRDRRLSQSIPDLRDGLRKAPITARTKTFPTSRFVTIACLQPFSSPLHGVMLGFVCSDLCSDCWAISLTLILPNNGITMTVMIWDHNSLSPFDNISAPLGHLQTNPTVILPSFAPVGDCERYCLVSNSCPDNFVAKLNNRFPTIKFTYEVEHNEQLPFLDVLVIRNSENKLEFDVYRKETATLRYTSIPNDSHHPFQHKMASFNFLIHRLLNFPLSKERFEHEKQLIKNIAKSNGYSVHLIDKLIRKHTFKRTLYNSTTFRRDTDNSTFASLPYEPKFTRGLDKIFKNININLVYNSKNKLQTVLVTPNTRSTITKSQEYTK